MIVFFTIVIVILTKIINIFKIRETKYVLTFGK